MIGRKQGRKVGEEREKYRAEIHQEEKGKERENDRVEETEKGNGKRKFENNRE